MITDRCTYKEPESRMPSAANCHQRQENKTKLEFSENYLKTVFLRLRVMACWWSFVHVMAYTANKVCLINSKCQQCYCIYWLRDHQAKLASASAYSLIFPHKDGYSMGSIKTNAANNIYMCVSVCDHICMYMYTNNIYCNKYIPCPNKT